MTYTQGIDVSHWQDVKWLDWKNKGYVFAWLKATEGTNWEDNTWKQKYSDAKQQDFYLGAYHYFRVAWNGAVQAAWFWNAIKDHQWDNPPMVDVERTNNLGYSQSVFAARLRNFLNEFEQLSGIRPVIYTNRSSWQQLIGHAAWATAYDLWVANYTTNAVPLIPDDWQGKGWKLWQYTSVPLDQDRFDGSLADFLEWIGVPPSTNLNVVTVTYDPNTTKIILNTG